MPALWAEGWQQTAASAGSGCYIRGQRGAARAGARAAERPHLTAPHVAVLLCGTGGGGGGELAWVPGWVLGGPCIQLPVLPVCMPGRSYGWPHLPSHGPGRPGDGGGDLWGDLWGKVVGSIHPTRSWSSARLGQAMPCHVMSSCRAQLLTCIFAHTPFCGMPCMCYMCCAWGACPQAPLLLLEEALFPGPAREEFAHTGRGAGRSRGSGAAVGKPGPARSAGLAQAHLQRAYALAALCASGYLLWLPACRANRHTCFVP